MLSFRVVAGKIVRKCYMLFQLGISSIEQAYRIGRVDRQLYAFDLLDRLDLSVPKSQQIIDRIMGTMPVGERSLRMTYTNRYPEVDLAIREGIEKYLPGLLEVTVTDLGVSSAIGRATFFL